MDDFLFLECPDCEFSAVVPAKSTGSRLCPMCAGDSGHDVTMRKRPARDDDRPEGRDARKE